MKYLRMLALVLVGVLALIAWTPSPSYEGMKTCFGDSDEHSCWGEYLPYMCDVHIAATTHWSSSTIWDHEPVPCEEQEADADAEFASAPEGYVPGTIHFGDGTVIPIDEVLPGLGFRTGTSIMYGNGPCWNDHGGGHSCPSGMPPWPECGYYGFTMHFQWGFMEYHDGYFCG